MFRILILGDGQYDVGSEPTRLYASEDAKPALACLVHRLLGEPRQVHYKCVVFREYTRLHPENGDFRKTIASIETARLEKFNAVVILTDRDGDTKGTRLENICKGREEMAGKEYPRSAVGQAVEAFDAWMIPDGKALQAAGATGKESHTDPESLDGKNNDRDPKVLAIRYLDNCRSDELGEKYAKIAAVIDIDLLEKCCPKGFKPFSMEVKENLAPNLPADC